MSYLLNPYIYGGLVSGYILFLDATNSLSYPGSGTTWTDLSGNGYNGTLINNPSYTSSTPQYFTFNYTNNYVTTTGMSNYSYTNGITISVWNYNGGGTGSYRTIDFDASRVARTSTETRPVNIAMLYCIKI